MSKRKRASVVWLRPPMLYSDALDSLVPAGGAWSTTVSEEWRQGRTLFGGLQVALGVRAMRSLAPDLGPLRTLHATFVAPVAAGPVSLEAELLRRGRSATQLECKLRQDGRVACLMAAVFGAARPSKIEIGLAPPVLPCDVRTLSDLPFVPSVTPDFARQLWFRWAEGGPPFSGAREARTKIFIRFRDAVRDPEAEVIALADAIPSPGSALLSSPAGLSSLTWTLELLRTPCAVPADAWWFVDTEVTAGREGYLSQSATLWTPGLEAAALSRQTVAIFG